MAISNNQEPASSQLAGRSQLSSARKQGRGGGVSQMPGRGSGRERTFMDGAGSVLGSLHVISINPPRALPLSKVRKLRLREVE